MYEEIKQWFFKNKTLSIGIGLFTIFLFMLIIKFMFNSSDSSLNNKTDTTIQAKTDLSHNNSVGGDSIGNIGKNYTRINTSGGEFTGRDKIVNYYLQQLDDNKDAVDIVYKEINITGKVVLKSNPKKGIEGIIVKVPYYSIQSEPTDSEGNFVIYKKKDTYTETGQLIISETSRYKASVVDDVDLQIQKIRIKLEKK